MNLASVTLSIQNSPGALIAAFSKIFVKYTVWSVVHLNCIPDYTNRSTANLIAGVQEMCTNLNGYFTYSTCYFVQRQADDENSVSVLKTILARI